MAQHSPGPWVYVENSWSDATIYAAGQTVATLSIEGEATEDNQDELAAVMDANARLIAAAPDMLEALKAIREWLLLDGPITEDGIWNKRFIEANNLAHAALAKAETA